MISLDASFIRDQKIHLSIQELRFGLEKGIVGPIDVIDVATDQFANGDHSESMERLALLLHDQTDEVERIIGENADTDIPEIDDSIRKWLFLQMKAIFIRNQPYDAVQSIVYDIYCEFGHPEQIRTLTPYFPADEDIELGEAALKKRWSEYLERESDLLQR